MNFFIVPREIRESITKQNEAKQDKTKQGKII